MRNLCSLALLSTAGIGLVLLAVQLTTLFRHLRAPPRTPERPLPPLSILKPLCGVDDDLAQNLELFATLDYPDYELLLGVKNVEDRAYPLALALSARHPGRVRVVRQQGEPGLNPKVNQLITLAAAARHQLLVVSDSNVRVERDYLRDIAAHFEDEKVGLVTHAIAGAGAERLGSLLDNLHLNGHVAPGVIGAKALVGKDIVVGKSMAMRRGDLRAMGGFEAVKDFLAEDYVIGRHVVGLLGKRVALGRRPVVNVSRDRSVYDFYDRYRRWGVIHRQAIGTFAYFGELLLNPIVVATAAFVLAPGQHTLSALAVVALLKSALDAASSRALQPDAPTGFCPLVVPAKDLMLAAAWMYGLSHSTVEWRGNKLRVHRGTWLHRANSARELHATEIMEAA